MLEFDARSTGEPASLRDVTCDANGLIEGVTFPTATPRVMHAERTFWEKATATHVFCVQGRLRGERFARHWHDLVRLDDAGIADVAISDRNLASAVARHKRMFFAEKTAGGTPWTMTPWFTAICNWSQTERLAPRSRPITRTWSTTASCLKTLSVSTTSLNVAHPLPSAQRAGPAIPNTSS